MKRLFSLFLLLITMFLFAACEQETILSIDQTSISIPVSGGSATLQLTANKVWSAKSDQSWCRVSPSTGENASGTRITITCDANQGYDERKGTVTFTCEEKMVSVSVSQSNASGLFVTTDTYELSNEKHTLTVEVKANVEYEVTSEVDWIKYTGTKGLATSQIILEIAENESYDSREGKVLVKQKNGSLSGTITIRQDRTMALFVTPSEFNLSNESQTIEVEVKYNVDFTTVVPEACQDWISIAGTKGLSSTTYSVVVSKNETYRDREGVITFKQKDGSLSGTVKIMQLSMDPVAFIVDLKEDTGKDEKLFLMDNCSYYILHSVEGESYESLYYNHSIADEVTDGMLFTVDRNDGSILVNLPGNRRWLFLKAGENVYNMADIVDGTVNLYIGITFNEDATPGPVSSLYGVQTKALSEDEMYIIKSALLKLTSFAGTAGSAVVGGPFGIMFAITTGLFEAYKSDIGGLQSKLSDYHIDQGAVRDAENITTVANLLTSFTKWQSVSKGLVTYNHLFTLLSTLNYLADEELAQVGKLKEEVAPALSDEYNIKLSTQEVVCQNADVEYVVNVSTKAMWDIDDSTVDHSWCDVRKMGDEIVVRVKQNKMSGPHSCYATVKGAVNSNIYHIAPVKLYITQFDYQFSLSEKELNYGKNGGSKPVMVNMSDNIKSWSISQCPDWCKIERGDYSFWVTVDPSEVGHDQSVIIVTGVVDGGGYIEAKLPVRQYATDDFELREKLIKFYHDTGGPNWTHNDNWCSDAPIGCWYGIRNQENGLYTILLSNNNLSGKGSLSGCTELENLYCDNNFLEGLNVSGCTELENLYCDNNFLEGLNVSGCTALERLRCDDNSLQSLEVSGCTALEHLYCDNNNLENLDVSECTSLRFLVCSDNNLNYLNVSFLTILEELFCSGNVLIELDLSNTLALKALSCSSNNIRQLDVSGLTSLEMFACSNGPLQHLDVSDCVALKEIYCFESSIMSLDVSNLSSLEILRCQNNSLEYLDVSGCNAIKEIYCYENSIKSIDVSNLSSLERLWCSNNSLEHLDVSGCVSLKDLICDNNEIERLDLSGLTVLESLYCGNNKNLELDVSGSISLKDIRFDNTLISLNASGCTSLEELHVFGFYHDSSFNINNLNLSGCTSLKTVISSDSINDVIKNLNVSGCSSLEVLNCGKCGIESLNVSGCTSLKSLDCYRNSLKSLIVSGCTSLETLSCCYNILQNLDVSGCTSLKMLDCNSNSLMSLNVSGCTSLETLSCGNNFLERLDVSKCKALTSLDCANNHIIQKINTEDSISRFIYDKLYEYWTEWDAKTQSYVKKYKKNDYGWYYEGEPEKGYHGR